MSNEMHRLSGNSRPAAMIDVTLGSQPIRARPAWVCPVASTIQIWFWNMIMSPDAYRHVQWRKQTKISGKVMGVETWQEHVIDSRSQLNPNSNSSLSGRHFFYSYWIRRLTCAAVGCSDGCPLASWQTFSFNHLEVKIQLPAIKKYLIL